MTAEDSQSLLARLADEIVRIITDTFIQKRQVVLLSYVGQILTRRGINFRSILGDEKLADFIRRQLSDKVTVVSMPSDELNLAAHPADVDLAKEIDPFGRQKRQPQPRSENTAASEKRPMVHRNVWFAFSHRLAEDQFRVLRLKPVIEYEDYPVEADPPPEGYAIDRASIVPAGTLPKEERDDQIYSNILAWASDAGADLGSITRVKTEKPLRRSALDVLLTALRSEDLARVTMPLDIVNQLRQKQV